MPAFNVRIIAVGALKEAFWVQAAAEYIKRLTRYCKLEIAEIKDLDPAKHGGEVAARQKEMQAIVKALGYENTYESTQAMIRAAVDLDKFGSSAACVRRVSSKGVGKGASKGTGKGANKSAIRSTKNGCCQVAPNSCYVVALDSKGEQFASEELAAFICDLQNGGVSHLDFLIGGSTGLDAGIDSYSQKSISFGRITLPHNLARIVLLEQLYRSFRIINNEPYHK